MGRYCLLGKKKKNMFSTMHSGPFIYIFLIFILLRVIVCNCMKAGNTKVGEDRIVQVIHLGKPAEKSKKT